MATGTARGGGARSGTGWGRVPGSAGSSISTGSLISPQVISLAGSEGDHPAPDADPDEQAERKPAYQGIFQELREDLMRVRLPAEDRLGLADEGRARGADPAENGEAQGQAGEQPGPKTARQEAPQKNHRHQAEADIEQPQQRRR